MIVGAPGLSFVEGYSEGHPGGGDGEDCSDGEAGAQWGVVPGQAGPGGGVAGFR